MFRSTLFSALALCALTLPTAALAQTKLATIDFQGAVLGTAEIKKAQADMTAKYKARQDALAKLQQELDAIQNELNNGKTPPSAARAADLQAQGTKKQRDAQRLSDDLQADVEKDRNDILQRAGTRMTEVVKKVAEEKGLDAVIDKPAMIYSKTTLDVTNDAIAAYDKAYPAK
jgi:outer membrane protein